LCYQIFLTDEDPTNSSEVSDDDFDYTVSSEHWNGVLKAVKNQNEDELKSRLQEVDDDVQKQELVDSYHPNSYKY
jgi:hypothetical protein